MRNRKQLLPLIVSLVSLTVAAAAQTPADQSKAGTPGVAASPSTTSAAAPAAPQAAQVPATATPAAANLNPKELQGMDVFASGGQQLGKVTKVDTLPDGKVKDVELQSGGFLGMFKKIYVVPGDRIAKKGSRIELSMTSDQAKQFVK
jgi:sporulation protein YlmC with PRC-barrel domain